MRISIEKVNEASLKCPEEIMTFTDSQEYIGKINKIGSEFSFHIDQTAALSDEVLFVLIGLSPRNSLAQNIKTFCETTPEISAKIVSMINTEIFVPIREYMQKEQESETVNESHRDSILDEIENPTPIIPTVHTNTDIELPKENLPKKEVSYPTNWMFPEQKKAPTPQNEAVPTPKQPTSSFEQILKNPTQTNAPRNPLPPRTSGSDPYRESIE